MLPPYPHQVKGFELLKARPHFALLCEMGAGKTRMVCMDLEHKIRAGDITNLLVIAPSGSYQNWLGELSAWLAPDIVASLYYYTWVSSAGVKAKRAFASFLTYKGDRVRVLLMNVEALSRVKLAKDGVVQFLKSGPAEIVIDEAQCIKTPDSLRTKFVLSLAPLARYRRILSGLIAPENPLDVYAPMTFLDKSVLGFSSYFSFRACYAEMQKIDFNNGAGKVNVVKGYRNLNELQRKISAASFRVRTAEVVDLPPRIYMPLRYVEMTPEQERLYGQMKKWATAELEGKHVTAQIAANVIMKLQQILCGHVRTEDGELHHVPSNRLASLLELLEDFGGKALIWAPQPTFLEKIAGALEKTYGPESTVRFWGETSPAARVEAKRRFQEDPKCRWWVSNPSVGGEGNNLTQATLCVYAANSWKNSERQQSEARAHRIGQEHPVTYVDLAVKGSVDEKLIRALRSKMDMSALLSGDIVLRWLI